MTMTAALAAWLTAQLDEDERSAQEAADGDSGRWYVGDRWNVVRVENVDDPEAYELVVFGNVKTQSEHIARHDPARVLAEVEAKRQLVSDHDPDWPRTECPTCCGYDGRDNYGVERRPREAYPCRVLRWLTLPYADRPGYDEAWRP